MILTRENLLESVRTRIGDDTSDEAIAFVENIADTLDDYETRVRGDGTDWKAKYEENDKEWREKYLSRFNAPVQDFGNNEDKYVEEKVVKTYEDLFKTEG